MVLWMVVVSKGSETSVYLTGSAAGFALTAIICAGFEHVVELTFPVNEGTTAGLMNVSAQVFGCVMIWIGEFALTLGGPLAVNGLMLGSIGE